MFDKAIEPLTHSIELTKAYKIPCYYHERAKAFLLIDKYKESIEDFNEVIQMQPRNSHAYFGRAFSFKIMKEYEKAAEDFEKAKGK